MVMNLAAFPQSFAVVKAVALAALLAATSVRAQDLYVSDQAANAISKITAGGTVTTFATGLSNPRGLAFDSAGNLYVANTAANTISKITPAGVVSTFASTGLSGPIGLAIDPADRVYVANDGANSVVRFDSGGNPTTILSGTPLNIVTGLALDASGNLYVGNQGDHDIIRITPDGTNAVFSTGIYNPQGMAFEASGNLLVIDANFRTITKIPPGGGTGTTLGTLPSGTTPFGLAIDAAGSIYSGDYSFGNIYRFDQAGNVQFFANVPNQAGVSFMTFARTPSFFDGRAALSNGIFFLAFGNGNDFGYYSYLSDPHYIYHFDLGYEYAFDANDGKAGVYLYDFESNDFFYTSPTFPFPYLYDFTLNAVLYYYPDTASAGHYTANPRYFYNFATGKIISK